MGRPTCVLTDGMIDPELVFGRVDVCHGVIGDGGGVSFDSIRDRLLNGLLDVAINRFC